MSSFDRKFEIVLPTLDRLSRMPLEVNDLGLINPQGTSPVPLIDGELVFLSSTGKYIRATDPTVPSFFVIEDRGDYGVQASRKMSAVIGPHGFVANTLVFDPVTVTTLGQALMLGTVNNAAVGSVNRAGLVAQTGTNRRLGFVLRLPATNRNLLQFISAMA
jgi:hypothetical protein